MAPNVVFIYLTLLPPLKLPKRPIAKYSAKTSQTNKQTNSTLYKDSFPLRGALAMVSMFISIIWTYLEIVLDESISISTPTPTALSVRFVYHITYVRGCLKVTVSHFKIHPETSLASFRRTSPLTIKAEWPSSFSVWVIDNALSSASGHSRESCCGRFQISDIFPTLQIVNYKSGSSLVINRDLYTAPGGWVRFDRGSSP